MTTPPYTWTWIDLRKGPLVVEVPPKVLGAINDMWYRWVIDVGITGPDKGKGGKYLLLPPGYKGKVPKGYIVVRPATFSNVDALAQLPGERRPEAGRGPGQEVHAGSIRWRRPPSRRRCTFVDLSGKPFNTVAPADYGFWELLNQVVQEEPTESLDPVRLGFYASIGIQKGKPFAPDERMKKILTEAAAVGDATARAIAFQMREKEDLLLREQQLAAPVHGRLQVRDAARGAEPRRLHLLLLRGDWRHARHGDEDGRPRLAVRLDGREMPTATRWTAARTTSCTCRPISRSRTSGR